MNKSSRLLVVSALAACMGFAADASTTYSMYCTSYGWLDNSPPGNAIAYPQIHSGAGGTGTYSDPVTFATDENELAPGTIVYIAYLKKYFIMEDDCAQCDTDWGSGERHIDLWAGGNSSSGQALINCEDSLTEQANVIVSPPSNESVDTTPLFNSSTKQCYVIGSGGGGGSIDTSAIYHLQNEASGLSLNQQGSTTNGSKITQWTSSSTSANLQWKFIATSGGYYQINSVKSGKDAVVQSASTSSGAGIIQWSFGSAGNDQWLPQQNSDGSYTFVNLHSGLVLEDPGSSTSTSTQMDQWGSNGGANQKWQLVKQ
jgi:hypothetical protein